MKVAIVIHSMRAGGAERVTATLASAWEQRGWDVHLITVDDIAGDFYRLPTGVVRHSLDLAGDSSYPIQAIVANARRMSALYRQLRRLRPDVVVAMMTTSGILSIPIGRLLGAPVVVAEHTYPPQLPLGRIWEGLRRVTYPFAARVTMLTSEGLAWLSHAIPRAQGTVIPNPVQLPLPQGEPRILPSTVGGPERRLLLAVGRLDSGKQINLLIDAFSVIASDHPTWSLAVVGDGPDRRPLSEQVRQLGLSERIRLVGRVGNISDWYERADLYVMASRFEGFPNTLAEALAHGCASVSYDCDTGPRDLIRDRVDGLLVRPVSDVAALANALDVLMGDDATRDSMSVRAKEVRERYSLDYILGLWDDLFDSLGLHVDALQAS